MSKAAKILIADDIRENLIALERILSDIDAEIMSVENGNKAVLAAFHNDFDLILMDVKMPQMDGFEAVKLIKKEEKNKYIPVIFLTAAYSDELSKIEGVKAGAVDFITKPISEDLLIGKVKLLLEIQKNRKELELMSKELSMKNRRLKEMLFYDSLTGVINRKPLYDLIEKNIKKAKRENKKCAILFLDLEKFKEINDIYGHDAGDLVLKKAAQKIKSCIRNSDLLGRIGGDEFVACLDNISNYEDAGKIAEKINAAFANKVKIDNNMINLMVSIGIAVYPDDGQTVIELLKNSDLAMFHAKKAKNNYFQFYNKKLSKFFMLQQSLFYALDNDEFSVYYQPIVNRKQKLAFMEALLRWNHKEYNDFPVSDMIAILERYKYINKVGKWLSKKVCIDINSFNKISKENIPVSINLSEIQMESDNFFEDFKIIIKSECVKYNNIYLEITERKQIKNFEKVKSVIHRLKDGNCKIIALDDFGSGFSSFSNLIRLPIDMVKIDKFLIDSLASERYKNATIDVIKLIKKIGLEVVAEGVETKEQFQILHEAGCDYFQGFYFYKPMPANEIRSLLLRNT